MYSIYVEFNIASAGMQCINQLLQKLLLLVEFICVEA